MDKLSAPPKPPRIFTYVPALPPRSRGLGTASAYHSVENLEHAPELPPRSRGLEAASAYHSVNNVAKVQKPKPALENEKFTAVKLVKESLKQLKESKQLKLQLLDSTRNESEKLSQKLKQEEANVMQAENILSGLIKARTTLDDCIERYSRYEVEDYDVERICDGIRNEIASLSNTLKMADKDVLNSKKSLQVVQNNVDKKRQEIVSLQGDIKRIKSDISKAKKKVSKAENDRNIHRIKQFFTFGKVKTAKDHIANKDSNSLSDGSSVSGNDSISVSSMNSGGTSNNYDDDEENIFGEIGDWQPTAQASAAPAADEIFHDHKYLDIYSRVGMQNLPDAQAMNSHEGQEPKAPTREVTYATLDEASIGTPSFVSSGLGREKRDDVIYSTIVSTSGAQEIPKNSAVAPSGRKKLQGNKQNLPQEELASSVANVTVFAKPIAADEIAVADSSQQTPAGTQAMQPYEQQEPEPAVHREAKPPTPPKPRSLSPAVANVTVSAGGSIAADRMAVADSSQQTPAGAKAAPVAPFRRKKLESDKQHLPQEELASSVANVTVSAGGSIAPYQMAAPESQQEPISSNASVLQKRAMFEAVTHALAVFHGNNRGKQPTNNMKI